MGVSGESLSDEQVRAKLQEALVALAQARLKDAKGRVWLEANCMDKAQALISEVLEHDPDNATAQRLARHAGHLDAQSRTVARLTPDDIEAFSDYEEEEWVERHTPEELAELADLAEVRTDSEEGFSGSGWWGPDLPVSPEADPKEGYDGDQGREIGVQERGWPYPR